GTACHLKGNMINYEFLRHYLNLKPGKRTTDDGIFSVEKARCFGCCSLAPVVMVLSRDGKYRKLYGYVDTAKLRKIVAEHRALARKLSNRRPR
ncbi:MAG TPA: NAD(P)H-dependent oxidoreductase subunit E, partial [Ignisphaera sp.]|nr:NAD(P)H-dependent oxidoreductase subunit E [Ignisphaera sp.]